MAFDAEGRIHVANYANHSITVYAAAANGDAAPTATISGAGTGLSGPYDVAFQP